MIEGARKETFNINTEKTKRRSININESSRKVHSVDSKINPARFSSNHIEEETYESTYDQLLTTWKFMRYSSTNQDETPCFIGVITLLNSQKRLLTSLTYLPPLQNPITEAYTIIQIFEISRNLSKQANMRYTHVIFDLGAAIKGFHVIWNQKEHWKERYHYSPWRFPCIYGIFPMCWKVYGFEEVVFQSRLCTSGSITGVLSGKHYNRYYLN